MKFKRNTLNLNEPGERRRLRISFESDFDRIETTTSKLDGPGKNQT
jgi:hypothetical protein